MNMRYLISIALAFALLLCACDKEDNKEDNIDYPITLYAHELSKVSDVRLFVNKNEIYDPNVIRTFVGNSEFFKLPTTAEIQSLNESICFLSEDSVLFWTSTTGFTVRKNANQFLFYSPLEVPVNSGDIVRPLLKYTGELVSMPSYAGLNYLTREVRVGYDSYKNLEISFLSYMLSRNGENGEDFWREFAGGRLLNEFNEEAINTL